MSSTRRFSADEIGAAADVLAAGGTVAFPTETVYGLGADAADAGAVAKIYEAKGRPIGHPLIVHVATSEAAWTWARVVDERARALADAFWPGPLTLILPRSDKAAAITVGDLDSVGLRVPGHPVARQLIEAFDRATGGDGAGVAGPSANRFGRVSPTTADHVVADLDGRIDGVVDGGSSAVGVESTIVELVDDRVVLLRHGGVTPDEISEVLVTAGLDGVVVDGTAGESRAAGMLASHYAPNASVVVVESLDGFELLESDGVIASAPIEHSPAIVLGADADGYAAQLYASLRTLDDHDSVDRIVVVAPNEGRLAAAVADRLAKAAAPRPG